MEFGNFEVGTRKICIMWFRCTKTENTPYSCWDIFYVEFSLSVGLNFEISVGSVEIPENHVNQTNPCFQRKQFLLTSKEFWQSCFVTNSVSTGVAAVISATPITNNRDQTSKAR